MVAFGIFIVAEFPKHFKAHTLVYSKRVINPEPPSKEYKKVTMDSSAFNKEFIVYATDAIEARYILSPTLMERILEYHKETLYPTLLSPTTLSFVDGNIYILNNCGDALSLCFAVSVVETLRLDRKLWSKY